MKLIISLAVTALLALSTVQALSFLEKEEILKKVALLQQETEEGDDDSDEVIATPSNGTESSILQELGLNKRVRRGGTGCYAAGPYGGGGGGAFHELHDNCNGIVTKLVVRSGSLVDSIQATYKLSNGQIVTGGYRGGTGGGRHEVILNAGEKIIAVFGASGRLLDRIGFVSNYGRVFGPYGGGGGGAFSVHNCVLRGIFGRSGRLIDSIGFYCGSL